MKRSVLVALAAVVGVLAVATPQFSGATFTTASSSTGKVTASSDWTPPNVALSVASTLTGTAALGATATDADSGVASLRVEQRRSGQTTWTTVCERTASPASCSWDTTTVADGTYEVRSSATDTMGNTGTSSVATVQVVNGVTVSLARPGDVVRGDTALAATVQTSGSASITVRIERAAAGTDAWTSVCAGLAAPYSCTWATTGVANGSYDLRAVALSGSTVVATSAVVRSVLVDNAAPSVTMTDPGSPLSGTRTFAATTTDAHSGVAKVVIQQANGSTWSTLCTVTSAPWSCSVDTRTLANGTYSFRAVATDVAGNTATSTAVTGRTVANVVSTVTLADPGAYLRGTAVALNATTTTNGTIAKVVVQRSPADAGTWTDVCTDTTSPYSCTLDTTRLADGDYDFRAVLTDTQGGTVTSAVVEGRTVDNGVPKAYDVQTTNGGTNGRLDTGDTISFTFSEKVALGSILSGWDGSAVAVTGRLGESYSNNDTFQVVGRTGTVRLGSVNLKEDFTFLLNPTADGTMTAETVTVDGVARTVVTVRFTSNAGLGAVQASGPASMVWTPAAGVTDVAGNALDLTAVTERGALDRDF